LIVILVLAVTVALLPFVIPVDAYRSRIEQIATNATGHALHIKGDLRLTVFPSLGIQADNVTLANVEGGKNPSLASMNGLRVSVKLLPLLSGNLQVSKVVLNRPVIHLEVDKAGNHNWTVTPTESAQAETGKSGSLGNVQNTRFNGVTISGGEITYYDARSGTNEAISDIDMDIAITSFDKPVTLDGQMTLRKEHFSIAAKIASPAEFLKSQTTPVDFSLTSDLMQASFKGQLNGPGAMQGKLKFDTPSLRKLARWASHPIALAGGLQTMSLQGTLNAKGDTYAFSALKLVLDGMTLTGDMSVNIAQDIPRVNGSLAIDDLNLNTYIANTGSTGGKSTTAAAPAPAQTGWSTKPIDLSVFRLLNGHLNLGVKSLEVMSLKVGRSVIDATLNNGVLNANLSPITLYGGLGTAKLTVNARGSVPSLHNALQFNNLQIKPFLTDTMGVNRLEGTGQFTLDVSSTGSSPKAIMDALSGKGGVTFKDGRIRGVDLGAVARTIETALSGAATADNASTDFTEMGGTFTIARGVMTNKDFHLLNPFLRISGAGTVDLGARTVNFVVKPKLVASAQGQGGKQDLAGIGIPFNITGPWSNLSYSPDLSGVAQGIMKSLQGGGISAKGLLDGFLGKGSAEPQSAKPGEKEKPKREKPNPADLIKGLFGGH
jgi:AsmA protein